LNEPVPLPEGFPALAAAANDRLRTRQSPPRIRIEKNEDGWQFTSPYPEDSGDDWFVLLCDAFGTRHGSVVNHFLECIIKLVPDGEWNKDHRYWYPDEDSFNAVLALISAMRPENEAQAAHAAQLAALHLSAMQLGRHIKTLQGADARAIAILGKTARAYGDGLMRLAKLQGKIQPRNVNQTITVVYADQRSVTVNGGVPSNGGQPHAAPDAGASARLPALPSPCPNNGGPMPPTGDAGKASVQDARRAWWRSIWRTQR
jgi:hypothetical protein